MSSELKGAIAIVLIIACLSLGIVIADKVQVVSMANRGLCYDIVQMKNKNPETQWEKCK